MARQSQSQQLVLGKGDVPLTCDAAAVWHPKAIGYSSSIRAIMRSVSNHSSVDPAHQVLSVEEERENLVQYRLNGQLYSYYI